METHKLFFTYLNMYSRTCYLIQLMSSLSPSFSSRDRQREKYPLNRMEQNSIYCASKSLIQSHLCGNGIIYLIREYVSQTQSFKTDCKSCYSLDVSLYCFYFVYTVLHKPRHFTHKKPISSLISSTNSFFLCESLHTQNIPHRTALDFHVGFEFFL